jgi:hypothetical protein
VAEMPTSEASVTAYLMRTPALVMADPFLPSLTDTRYLSLRRTSYDSSFTHPIQRATEMTNKAGGQDRFADN